QLKYVFLGFFILAVTGPLAYLPAYGIGVYPFAYVSGVIFTSIIGYAIIAYQLLEVQVITTELFAGLLVIVTFFNIFQAKNSSDLILKIAFFIAATAIAILLIRSVLKEVRRREELEK